MLQRFRACAALATVASVSLHIPSPASAQTFDPVVGAQEAMAAAASDFLATLNGARRASAHLPFEDEVRMGWQYIPAEREGLLLADMTAVQRQRVHVLLRTALSGTGYLKITSVMQLEEVLRAIETAGFARSVEGYVVAVFGDPASGEPWGWRFEGHHVSLNFTSVAPGGLSATPLFLGSNPAEVRSGSWAGLRVLHREEDLARELLRSLSPDLRARAVVSPTPPNDILTRNDPVARELPVEGLPAGEMGSESRVLLLALLEEFAGNLDEGVAEAHLSAVRTAGVESLHFVWSGGVEAGEPHYYRIQGPTVLVEFDNVQGEGNHVHSVWRDLENDFGGDLLRRHYETADHTRNP
ncbi:MAG: DUF3500 domain-containing protein [Gemmatimonadota bacterium]